MMRPSLSLIVVLAPCAALAQAPSAGTQCTMTADAKVAASPGDKATLVMSKGTLVSIVEVTRGFARVEGAGVAGVLSVADVKRLCRGVTQVPREPGSQCRARTALKLSAAPAGKGAKVSLKAGAVLTVAEANGDTYKLTLGTAVGYAALASLNRSCAWQPPAATASAASASPASVPLPPEAATSNAPTPVPAASTESAAPLAAAGPPPETPAKQPFTLPGVENVAPTPDPAGKTKIAVMNLRHAANIDNTLVLSLGAIIPQALDDLGPFKAISSQDIEHMLQMDTLRQQVGCDTTTCLAEIGGALGVDYMVSGSILLAGDTYLIQLQLMNITRSRVDGRATREYKGGPAGLFDEMRTATKLLVRDVLSAQSGQLSVAVSEEGATVRLDGTIVGTSPMPAQTVPGGMHTVTVDKEGFIRFSRDVEVRAHELVRVDAPMRPSPEFLDKFRSRASTVRGVAWTALSVGLAGLGAAGALYVVDSPKASKLATDIRAYNASGATDQATYDDLQQRKRSLATMDAVTIVAGSVGLVAAVTGVIVLATADSPTRYDRPVELGTSVGQASAAPTFGITVAPRWIGAAVAF